MKFTQHVLVQKLEDEYLENKAPKTPAVSGKINYCVPVSDCDMHVHNSVVETGHL